MPPAPGPRQAQHLREPGEQPNLGSAPPFEKSTNSWPGKSVGILVFQSRDSGTQRGGTGPGVAKPPERIYNGRMESLFNFVAPPTPCGYLPDQLWSLEYEVVADLTAGEYMDRMRQGWRRFGDTMFRPRCASCHACRSLRILANQFRPDRSQRRVRKLNDGEVRLRIGVPSVSRAKLDLYDRYHAFRTATRGWPRHEPSDPYNYRQSFVDNPFPTQEWCYYLGQRLVGVGYVDDLPGGLSAIYFFYDPECQRRSLGTWNILCLLKEAVRRRPPHLYLGYYVAGCASMTYKAQFRPNQALDPSGGWQDFVR